MKRENAYLVGAALLASTSITTAASAATFQLATAGVANSPTVSTTARPLSAQAFASTPLASQVLGPASLLIRFNSTVQSNNVNITATLAGARFVTSSVPSSAETFAVSAGVSIIAQNPAGTNVCSVQAQTDRLIITSCNIAASAAGFGSASGIIISNISFDNATGLATAGTSVTLATDVTIGTTSLETTAATAIITSRNSITGTSVSNSTALQANVSAATPFTQVVSSGLSANIGTINITRSGAVAADLSSAIAGATAVGGNTEVKVTTPFIGGNGFQNLRLSATTSPVLTRGLTQNASGSVTFAIVNAASIQDEFTVAVEFTGTTAIDNTAAGTTTIAFVSAGAQSQTANAGAPPAISGTVSGITRSGLSVDVNGVQPGIAQGLSTNQSIIRIVNTGSAAGAAVITVRNNDSGATLGTYTSASIPAGGSLQLTSPVIEAGAVITPSASVLYRLVVSGSLTGYVQHFNYNPTGGVFSEMSGRRTNTTGNTAGTGQ